VAEWSNALVSKTGRGESSSWVQIPPSPHTAAAISLVVFSAATMAFLFFYRPLVLLLEHRSSEAVAFFLKTLATFGVIGLLAILTVV
jgi:hypothetical protein